MDTTCHVGYFWRNYRLYYYVHQLLSILYKLWATFNSSSSLIFYTIFTIVLKLFLINFCACVNKNQSKITEKIDQELDSTFWLIQNPYLLYRTTHERVKLVRVKSPVWAEVFNGNGYCLAFNDTRSNTVLGP